MASKNLELFRELPMLLVSLLALIVGTAEVLIVSTPESFYINCYLICIGVIFQSAILPVLFRYEPEVAR